jgi:hypothetical protein
LGWKEEGVVELGFKFISKMSFIQCWVGLGFRGKISLRGKLRGNAQIQTMSHLVMVNRLQKIPNWVKIRTQKLCKIIIMGKSKK